MSPGFAFKATEGDRKHVLFVDADILTHRYVERAVRDIGLRVTCVADGAHALRVLEQQGADLLITTLAMPVIDGVDLLRHVVNRGLALPVIVLTAHDASPSVQRSPLRFVQEDRGVDVLVDAIHSLLGVGRPARSFGLAEFAQVLAAERRSCTLVAIHAEAHAQLVFTSGVLVDATLGSLRGDAAARALLAWPQARLRVDPRVFSREVTVRGALTTLLPVEPPTPIWESRAAKIAIAALLDQAMRIDGALGVGLAAWELGDNLGTRTVPGALVEGHMNVAMAGNCRLMRAMAATLSRIGDQGGLQDLVVSLDDQLHVLAPLKRPEGLFINLVLDGKRSNMVLARNRVARLLARHLPGSLFGGDGSESCA